MSNGTNTRVNLALGVGTVAMIIAIVRCIVEQLTQTGGH